MFLCSNCHTGPQCAPATSNGPCENCRRSAACADCHCSTPFGSLAERLGASKDSVGNHDVVSGPRIEGNPEDVATRRYRFAYFDAGQPHVQVEDGRIVVRGSVNYFVHKNATGQDVYDDLAGWHPSVRAALQAQRDEICKKMQRYEERHARNMRILKRKLDGIVMHAPVVKTYEESRKERESQ